MRAKLSILLLCLMLPLFSGCQSSRKIETASIIENVSISESGGQIYYTFYVLSSGDKPKGIRIPSDSFESACLLAEKEYIPNLSLSKLELLMIEDSVLEYTLKNDIEYISAQPFFSPVAYVTLCDKKTTERFDEDTGVQDLIEEQLILLKNNNPEVSIDYLSVFNRFASGKTDDFTVGYVTCEDELKISERKIIKNNVKKFV